MQVIDLNLTSGGVPPVVHASQGDVMLPVKFVIYDNGEEVTIPSGAVVSIRGTKADGHSFSYSSDSDTSIISWNGSTVSVYTSEQMTAAAGIAIVELRASASGMILHTANFLLDVEASALPADADLSKSDMPMIEQGIKAGESAAASAKEAAASAKEAAASAKEAAQSITGVSSWNGRTGAVKPQSGDYTAAMVGALSSADVDNALSASSANPVQNKVVNAAVSEITKNVNSLSSIKKVTVSTSGWASSTTTVNGSAYYTYEVTGLTVYDQNPDISIGASGTLPTSAEQAAYECLKYGIVSGTTLTLYADAKPTSAFVINVRGVA